MAKRITIIILIILVFGCTHEKSSTFNFEKSTRNHEKLTLAYSNSKSFKVDSTLGIFNSTVQLYNTSKGDILTIFNSQDGSIHYFDYQNTGQIRKQIFEIEGPNGTGKISNMGHYVINSDSVFLFNHWTHKALLYDSNSRLINDYPLKSEMKASENMILINASRLPHYYNERLLVPLESSGNRYNEMDNFVSINLRNKETKSGIGPSPYLDSTFHGPLTPYSKSVAYNFVDGEIIVSSYRDPHIRVYDMNTFEFIGSYLTESEFIDEFVSFPKKNNEPPLFGYSYMKIADKTNMNAMFTDIIADPYNNVYYRFLLLPRTQLQYAQRAKGMQFSVIILNSNFERIGEKKLPAGKYSFNTYFLNQDGLYLANLEEYEKDEDRLVFDNYKLLEQ